MPAGYSGTPLWKKLGYKPGTSAYVCDAPGNYRALLAPLPEGVVFRKAPGNKLELAHIFVAERRRLEIMAPKLVEAIRPAGMIWVSWPKKSSGVRSDMTEDVIREIALSLGLVDVKVCAVDEIWSGLKLVIRKELR
ncbi:MAG: DUF3052 domain-containing protein [Alphaproteobacteria bacterium RIFCSPHIGHO2_12_FULL_63_12]|nr:MAG: DUF3052 domain-containing protein [Alphaproteobacteria bacterium RIFCSPHIGHO2_12_FULL_63_12]